MKAVALIVAAGQSVRFGGELPKQYQPLGGKPMLAWTISRFEAAPSIEQIVVVVAEDYLVYCGEAVIDPYKFSKVHKLVSGGATRQESVHKGLKALPANTELVAIHDGARPLVAPQDIDAVVSAAERYNAAMLAAKITDTVKRVEDGVIVATLDRHVLYGAQTPQVFRYDIIASAHAGAQPDESMTDDALLVEAKGIPVHIVEPTRPNFKVTTPDDLALAEALLQREQHA